MGINRRRPALRAVIMAGGKGRRFWPRSREARPKQLLPIGAPQPLLAETVARLLPILAPENIFISCGADIAAAARAVVPMVPAENFIIEPEGRDTAACVGLAMEHLTRRAGAPDDAVIAVLPADHVIGAPARFRTALRAAARVAGQGLIATIGIAPDRPSTAFGYLQPGPALAGEPGARRVARFVEKPDEATARRYVKRGYCWNAGMFIFRLDVMRAEYERLLPAMAAGLTRVGALLDRRGSGRALAREFHRLEKVSIDYGIMERANHVAMVAGEFGWMDVGGWEALYRLRGGDGKKNVASGPLAVVDSRGCYVESERMVALVGVDDLVVIETADALLVMRRDRESGLKELAERMKKAGRSDLL